MAETLRRQNPPPKTDRPTKPQGRGSGDQITLIVVEGKPVGSLRPRPEGMEAYRRGVRKTQATS